MAFSAVSATIPFSSDTSLLFMAREAARNVMSAEEPTFRAQPGLAPSQITPDQAVAMTAAATPKEMATGSVHPKAGLSIL